MMFELTQLPGAFISNRSTEEIFPQACEASDRLCRIVRLMPYPAPPSIVSFRYDVKIPRSRICRASGPKLATRAS